MCTCIILDSLTCVNVVFCGDDCIHPGGPYQGYAWLHSTGVVEYRTSSSPPTVYHKAVSDEG